MKILAMIEQSRHDDVCYCRGVGIIKWAWTMHHNMNVVAALEPTNNIPVILSGGSPGDRTLASSVRSQSQNH